ncbi:hypothetical protein BV372_25875 [Nostoc sp. T09]|uniref:hypothetical protein n=1 Tax=Nostoc sp. T09 TaxID=1932621 RepID=UPI000A3D4481|nr:hypothetical protein [Nostoc sp. T09]OUL27447.1 hypothetical protein BV372_25875 [Nostoc sp. T09]
MANEKVQTSSVCRFAEFAQPIDIWIKYLPIMSDESLTLNGLRVIVVDSDLDSINFLTMIFAAYDLVAIAFIIGFGKQLPKSFDIAKLIATFTYQNRRVQVVSLI